MKHIAILSSLIFISCTGCKFFGSNPAPPTTFEKAMFDTVTNYVTKEVPVTNIVTKVVEIPVNITNTVGATIWNTNTVTERYTNITSLTVTQEAYTLTPKESAKAVVATGASVLNAFVPGAGPIVSTGLVALLGLWAHLRGTKMKDTAVAISQEVETIREFVKTLPQGTKYDQAITNFMQQHQVASGVANQVLSLLKSEISNADAKVAVNEIQNTIKAVS